MKGRSRHWGYYQARKYELSKFVFSFLVVKESLFNHLREAHKCSTTDRWSFYMHSNLLNNNSMYQGSPPLDLHFWGSPERKLRVVAGEDPVVQGKSRPVEAEGPVDLHMVHKGPKQAGSPVLVAHIPDWEIDDSSGTVCTVGAAHLKIDNSFWRLRRCCTVQVDQNVYYHITLRAL